MEGKKGISEDWLSLWLGLFVFVLGLGLFLGIDLLGWGVKTSVWVNITKAITPMSASFKTMPGIVALFLTYLFMLVLAMVGAIGMKAVAGRFILAFSLVFWISYACFLTGNYAYIAANTPAMMKSFRDRLVSKAHR